jgi:alpha-glucosidase
MIDDNWQEDYGIWRFHPGRFPDPKSMIDSLHAWGFKVMLWTCPFVSGDSEVFRKLQTEHLLLSEPDGYPKMVRWWNGSSAVLDFTNQDAVRWYNEQLRKLCSDLGVDGFKFDAGDPEFYLDTYGKKQITPNDHTELFAKIGVGYPFNEYRATWKMGGQPLAQRLRDKGHSWNDLKLLIPDILLQGIIGYPFTCPDMIGGGEMGSFVNLKNVDQDLVVRSAQCHALMPMMQFSVAPWRILDEQHLTAVLQAIELRSKHIELIEQLVDHAAKTGEPIVRMMAYEFPDQGLDKILDQFMLGNQILVAPILERSNTRNVGLPSGKWRDMRTGKTIVGPKSLTITAELNELPYFMKVK